MEATQTSANGNAKGETNGKPAVPGWLVAEAFEDLLRKTITGYHKITHFKAYPAMAAGENYATQVLRVEIEVELQDGKPKTVSYMLKVPLGNPAFQKILEKQKTFDIEQGMYLEVVPEMEQMLRDVGVEVQFSAQCFKLQEECGKDYVLLEDLRPRGFKNANRLEGLDMMHTKCVLTKLAQWHAASATRAETKGRYADIYTLGFFNYFSKPFLKTMTDGFIEPIEKCLKTYQGSEVYGESVLKLQKHVSDEFFKLGKIDSNEFNVLNHGDCWSNNIMFQYDAFGKIKETYFVDYQIPKYGSPAQDLLYFLISSTSLELKLKEFDFFIKFYHDNLVKHLQLLNYPKRVPALKDLHVMLYKYGLWGFSTATGTMAAVLLDPTESASIENFLGTDDAGNDFKMAMFSNPRYRKHIETILPWLHNRGALECSI